MSVEKQSSISPTFQKHRREFIWQILMPVILAGVLVLGAGVLMVLTTTFSASRTSHWAAISLIWLIAPLLFVVLLFVVLNIGLIYLMSRLLKILPPYLRTGQLYAQIMTLRVKGFCDRLARPFVRWGGWAAGFRTLRSKIIHR